MRYGKVVSRVGRPDSKYHEYTLVASGNPGRAAEELERALYHIIPQEQDAVRKTPSWPRSWANFSLSSCVPTGMHGQLASFGPSEHLSRCQEAHVGQPAAAPKMEADETPAGTRDTAGLLARAEAAAAAGRLDLELVAALLLRRSHTKGSRRPECLEGETRRADPEIRKLTQQFK